jgi:hypothetical protein
VSKSPNERTEPTSPFTRCGSAAAEAVTAGHPDLVESVVGEYSKAEYYETELESSATPG